MANKSWTKSLLLMLILISLVLATRTGASAPEIPNPVLFLTVTEAFQQGGKEFIRYRYDVFNKELYPGEMFASAPKLPPCGTNTKASRTWVDIYSQAGKRLNSFCALKKPADLSQLWFALEAGVVPPSYVYVELNDRQTNRRYKSNLAETTQ